MDAQLFIIDRHEPCQAELGRMIARAGNGFRVAAALSDPAETFLTETPDIVLYGLDSDPGGEGILRLQRRFPDVPVLAITPSDEPGHALDAIVAGAAGVVHSRTTSRELSAALDAVLHGRPVVEGPSAGQIAYLAARRLTTASDRDDRIGALTNRERQVLEHLSEGTATRGIAQQLGVSRRTVERHLYNAYRKLGVSGRIEALRAFTRMQREAEAS